MNKNQIKILTVCALLCFAVLGAMYAVSPISKDIQRGGFNRRYINKLAIKQIATVDLKVNSYYVAGATKSKIYLGNPTTPFQIAETDYSLNTVKTIKLKIEDLDSVSEPERFKLQVDSPFFFLEHGDNPIILRGKLGEWRARKIMKDTAYYFVDAVPISRSSFAIKSYSSFEKGYELAKKTIDSPYFSFKYDLLEKQIDGMFCVDGKLNFNKDINRLVYVYFYRNQYIVADTNLSVIYRGNTIDTFSRARIKIAKIGKKNETALAAPPMEINGTNCTAGKYLFIQSNLLADNDDKEKFLGGATIDVYNLQSGKYEQSFHIDKYQNKRPLNFKVFNNYLGVIFDRNLVLYSLNPEIFPYK